MHIFGYKKGEKTERVYFLYSIYLKIYHIFKDMSYKKLYYNLFLKTNLIEISIDLYRV